MQMSKYRLERVSAQSKVCPMRRKTNFQRVSGRRWTYLYWFPLALACNGEDGDDGRDNEDDDDDTNKKTKPARRPDSVAHGSVCWHEFDNSTSTAAAAAATLMMTSRNVTVPRGSAAGGTGKSRVR